MILFWSSSIGRQPCDGFFFGRTKIHKASKVAKFKPEDLSTAFFENMMDDLAMKHFETDHAVGQIPSSAINSAIELSKLVIENKVRKASSLFKIDR